MRLNAQAAVRGYLARSLDVPVCVSVPNPRPEKCVTVRREGGRIQSDKHRDKPGIGIYVYAKTEAEAADLAAEVSALMLKAHRLDGIADVQEEAFYSSPDLESNTPRWYGSYTLTTTL